MGQLRRQVSVQRGVIVSLEQDIRKISGLRQALVDCQRAMIAGRMREARELLSEVLLRWPTI